jgi:hypothetical protein
MFEKAVQDLKKLTNEPDNDIKLKLYGLFKQVFSSSEDEAYPWNCRLPLGTSREIGQKCSTLWAGQNMTHGTSTRASPRCFTCY